MYKNLVSVLVLFFAFLSCSFSSQKDLEGGVLWEISGNGLEKPSYLLGTWHGTFDILYSYVDSIPGFQKAFDACTQYVGEAENIDNMEEFISSFDPKLPRDTSYTNLLDEPEYSFLDSVLVSRMNVPLDKMYLKPAFLALVLRQLEEQAKLVKAGYSQGQIDSMRTQVMDVVLYTSAKDKQYNVLGLETIKEQLDMLFPEGNLKVEASQLIIALRDQKVQTLLIDELHSAYRSQDINRIVDCEKKIRSAFQDEPLYSKEYDDFLEKMIDQRNRDWVQKLPGLIKDNPTFIAVGVRHLPGKNGVICLLREKGYRVEAFR